MTNVRIMYTNLGDTASSISASSEATDFDVEHVQVIFPQVRWRATSDSDESVTFDFGTATATTGGVIFDHNLSSGATITLEGSATGAFAGEETTVETFTWFSGPIPGFWNSASYRYQRFRFQDAANSDGYVQVGRLWLGTYFEPATNYELGSKVEGFVDTSVLAASTNNVEVGVSRPQRRTWAANFPIVTAAEYDNWVTFREAVGVSNQFVIVPDWDSATYKSTQTMLCRLSAPLAIRQGVSTTVWDAALAVREAL